MKAKIFAFLEIAFISGVLVAPLFEETKIWLFIGLVLSGFSVLLFRINKTWFLVLGLGLFFISIYYFQDQKQYSISQNAILQKQEQIYSGIVSNLPTQRENGYRFNLDLKQKKGNLTVYTNREKPSFGTIVKIKGKVKPYAKSINYLIKENSLGEISVKEFEVVGEDHTVMIEIKRLLFSIRENFSQALRAALPQEEAGLAGGLIMGEKNLMSADFIRDLQGSGTSHIVALSGYNITIIIGLFALFFPYLSRRSSLLFPIIFVVCFVLMAGGSASVVRASIMGLMPVIARYFGRGSDSFLAILFSAFIMILLNPFILLYDVGFQLSFAALVGMIYLSPFISKLFLYLPSLIGKIFSETIGAQVAVLPLVTYYFGYVSIISPISNLIILSLIPVAMLLSFMIGTIQLVLPIVNTIFVFPVYFILHFIISLIHFFGSLPIATVKQKIENPYIVVLVYLLFIDLLFLIKNRERKHFEKDL